MLFLGKSKVAQLVGGRVEWGGGGVRRLRLR